MKSLALIFSVSLFAVAVNAQELTWPQLAQHAEFWPSQCHLKKGFHFQGGASVNAGDMVDVVEIHAKQIEAGTTAGKSLVFDVKPEDTDVLEMARTA